MAKCDNCGAYTAHYCKVCFNDLARASIDLVTLRQRVAHLAAELASDDSDHDVARWQATLEFYLLEPPNVDYLWIRERAAEIRAAAREKQP